jgi:hypothetical protein
MMIDVDWRHPFIDYLSEQKVPSDKNLAKQLKPPCQVLRPRRRLALHAGRIFKSTHEVRSQK